MTVSFFISPALRNQFTDDDKLLEILTDILLFAAFVLGLIYVSRLKEKKLRRVYLPMPFLSLFFLLEKISYGERIFHLKMPVMYGTKIDSLHDFAQVAYNAARFHGGNAVFVSLILLFLSVVSFVFLKCREYFRQAPRMFVNYPPLGFLLLSAAFIFNGQILDLGHVSTVFFTFIEK